MEVKSGRSVGVRWCLWLRLLLLLSLWAVPTHALGETYAKGGLNEGAGGVRSSDWFFEEQKLDVSVRPILTRAEYNENSSITIDFRSDRHHLVVDIHPTSDLLADSYQESPDTKKTDNNITVCDFQGQVRGHPDSWAALSICEGIRGVVVSQGREVLVEPSPGTESPEGRHRIFSNQRVKASGHCGVEDGDNRQTISTTGTLRRERRASLHGPLWTDKRARFVELVMVLDRSFYDKFGERTRSRCRAMVNIVNAMYRPLGIVVVLTGIEIWERRDEITVTSRYKTLLEHFKKYRQDFLKARPELPNDNMALITRVDFDGNTVGYASVKGMCSKTDSVSVVQDKNDAVGIVAQTLAHEMGHNLGMNHDDDDCACEHKCVMDGTGSNVYNTSMAWSSCSKNYLAQGFSSASFDCLKNIPTTFYGASSCGNGVVEEGEQCDCGPTDYCDNPCCDHTTCKLAVNATCASGSCCDVSTCNPKPVGTTCRSALSECDLPEYCPGDSEYCPVDVFKRDGLQCFEGTGHCYKGECGSHEQRCKAVWGPTSIVAQDTCYDLNVRGSSDSNCGFVDSDFSYLKKCPEESIRCGSLHCVSTSSTPESNYRWGSLRIPTRRGGAVICQYLPAHEGTPDKFWLSPDGATCGANKMCVDQQCRSIAEPDGVSECPNGCSENGVCNSKGHCHCDAGFAPPDCSAAGYGGSFDSGHMEEPQEGNPLLKGLLIFAFLLIACAVIFCCMFGRLRRWWEKRGRTCATSCLPCFATCVDTCCCFLMAKFTHWVVSAGPLGKEKHAVQRQVEEKSTGDRTTICQVNVDFNDSLPKMNSWGVADTQLMTDIITVTPKNSPDFRRKVQLPSDSPVLHHKSNERLDRPKYLQSLSVDSGCIVDDEEVVTKEPVSTQMSMSSLVSAFKKFNHKGSKTPERELDRPRFPRQGSKTPDRDLGRPALTTQKSMPLSRFVLDPRAGNRSSRQGTPPPEDMRPDLRRSVSTDVASAFSTRLHGNRPAPPSTALKPHKSDDNIHNTKENPFFPPDMIMAPPGGPRRAGSPPAASSSNESLEGRPRTPILPPGTTARPSRVAPPPPPPPGQKKPKGPPKMPPGGKGGPPKPPDASSKPNGSPNSSVKDMIRRMDTK